MKIIDIPDRILEIALLESKKTNVKKGRVSALALDSWNVRHKAHNVKILGHKSIFSIHAENRLISKYRGTIDTLLIYRNINHKDCAISRPCSKCMYLIKEAGIKFIIYYDGMNWIKEKIR